MSHGIAIIFCNGSDESSLIFKSHCFTAVFLCYIATKDVLTMLSVANVMIDDMDNYRPILFELVGHRCTIISSKGSVRY